MRNIFYVVNFQFVAKAPNAFFLPLIRATFPAQEQLTDLS
jgi:hypothetical protein